MISGKDITFVRCIKESKTSSVFEVSHQGRPCLMKVVRCLQTPSPYLFAQACFDIAQYHGYQREPWDPTYREVDPYLCEKSAYVRFQERGLCQQGIVPDYYGVIEQIDPHDEHYRPHLSRFLKDELRPNAVLLEFIPNMQKIDLTTYTEDRAAALVNIIEKIHSVGVCHADPWPRNMMVQPETGRVLWIDFDRAQTCSDEINDRQREWMESDFLMTTQLMEALAADKKEGKLVEAWHYYYHYS